MRDESARILSVTESIEARCRAALEPMRCAATPASRARETARSWALQSALSSAVVRAGPAFDVFAVRRRSRRSLRGEGSAGMAQEDTRTCAGNAPDPTFIDY